MAKATIAPKDKAFLSMKIVQESMDAHAKRLGMAFGDWVYKNYTQFDITDGWVERARPLSKNAITTERLYDQFIESINK